MTEENNLDSVMRRVKKLLAIAQDARGDANECAAAARMAESIMRKYEIEHADVISAEIKNAGAEAFDYCNIGAGMDVSWKVKTASGWAGWLAVAVANLYECQARYGEVEGYKTIKFSGYRTDVQMAKFTYEYIVNQMGAASREFTKNHTGEFGVRAEAESFRRGFIQACIASLKKLIEEKKAEMQEAASSRALVIVKSQAVAQHFGEVKYGASNSKTRQGEAYDQGRTKGSQVDVTRRGVGHSGGTAPRLK
jgi:hypothetical protein